MSMMSSHLVARGISHPEKFPPKCTHLMHHHGIVLQQGSPTFGYEIARLGPSVHRKMALSTLH